MVNFILLVLLVEGTAANHGHYENIRTIETSTHTVIGMLGTY